MGFKLGDIIHHARLAPRRPDPDEAPAQGYTVAPENPVLTDGADEGEMGDEADPNPTK